MAGPSASLALILGACTAGPDTASQPTQARTPQTKPTTAEPVAPCEHGEADVAVGVFRETRRERIDEYEQWLGCRVDYVVDFPSRNTWFNIANPGYLLDEWEGMDRRLVLSVAMLPVQEEADFVSGARGEYDSYFAELGQRLVDRGMQDAILRLGWEFNLTESPWFTEDTESFRAYWQSIVEAMRSVPGQEFEFTWNLGRSGIDAVPYYPGDEFVDHVGVDVYDATGGPGTYPYPEPCSDSCRMIRQRQAWSAHIYGGERGLRFWTRFASEHDKPVALPEWGLWERPKETGGGENPFFIKMMYDYISNPANDVAYQAYFEFDGSDGEHRLMTTFSEVGDLYRSLLAP